jgi:hypothetical protein
MPPPGYVPQHGACQAGRKPPCCRALPAAQGWIDRDAGGASDSGDERAARVAHAGRDDVDVDEDERYLEEADRYEARYNFRFEEPGGKTIATYPRGAGEGLRREDTTRRSARQRKAERRAEQEEQRAAEVRRLKNLKRQEIQERCAPSLGAPRDTTGTADPAAAAAAVWRLALRLPPAAGPLIQPEQPSTQHFQPLSHPSFFFVPCPAQAGRGAAGGGARRPGRGRAGCAAVWGF